MQNQQQHNENLHPRLYQPSLWRTAEARERERKRKAESMRKDLVFRANLLNLCENHTGMFSSCGWLTLTAHTHTHTHTHSGGRTQDVQIYGGVRDFSSVPLWGNILLSPSLTLPLSYPFSFRSLLKKKTGPSLLLSDNVAEKEKQTARRRER